MEVLLRLGFGWFGRGFELGSFGGALLGVIFGFAHAVAFALDADYVRVVHDAVDECSGTGGIGEDGVPVAKRNKTTVDSDSVQQALLDLEAL